MTEVEAQTEFAHAHNIVHLYTQAVYNKEFISLRSCSADFKLNMKHKDASVICKCLIKTSYKFIYCYSWVTNEGDVVTNKGWKKSENVNKKMGGCQENLINEVVSMNRVNWEMIKKNNNNNKNLSNYNKILKK